MVLKTILFRLLVGFSMVGFAVSAVNAQDRPTNGLVFHTTENSSITFFCERVSENVIDCDFVQTFVRQEAKPEDLETALKKSSSQYEEEIKIFKNFDCGNLDEILMMLGENGSNPNADAKLSKLPVGQLDDLRNFAKSYFRLCKSPTRANFQKMIRINHEKNSRTCRVGSFAFQQRMKRTASGSWAVIPEATGECGVVQLDRFEPANQSRFTFWNYIARKTVTNPSGRQLLMQCENLDEAEYVYEWKSRDIYMNCNYIKFSPM
jgi:hypothetical protein